MKNGIRFAALSILFFSFAFVASADVIVDPDSPNEPQPFTFYCQPYTEPFLSGGEYITNNGETCFYTIPQLLFYKAVLLYKGVEGNATFIQGGFTENEPRSSLRLPSNFFGNAVQGDNFFAVSFSSNSFSEVISGETYMRTGGGVRPADTTVLSWKWGAPPSGGSETSPLTVSADNKNMIYGNAIPALSATLSGFVNGDDADNNDVDGNPECTTDATSQSSVGEYEINCTVNNLTSTDYTFETLAGTLTISPKTLTVKADDKTIILGGTLPSFTYTISTFVNGDTESDLSGDAECSATASNAVGSYPITCTGTLASNNYEFDYINGALSVVYQWSEFLQPITDTGHQITENTSVFKAGSTVPVKFRLLSQNGDVVQSEDPIVWLVPIQGPEMNNNVSDAAVYTEQPSSGYFYVWSGDHYQYNWKTSKDDAGYWYYLWVIFNDGSIHYTVIGLR